MSENILEIRHLGKSFGTHEVLRDIDFTVKKGDVISIIGASGSGKSIVLAVRSILGGFCSLSPFCPASAKSGVSGRSPSSALLGTITRPSRS